MDDIMKVYCIRYQWKQIIEVVYEYLISECEKYFHVKNQDCLLFHVEPNEKDKTLIIALMYDECEQYFKDNISHLQALTLQDYSMGQCVMNCRNLFVMST